MRSEYDDPVVEPILDGDRMVILSEMRPSDDEYDLLQGIEVDINFDWVSNQSILLKN